MRGKSEVVGLVCRARALILTESTPEQATNPLVHDFRSN